MSMEETFKDLIDEEVQEQAEDFSINDGAKAEWALQKIIMKKKELQQYQSICDAMISDYEKKKNKKLEQYQMNIGFLEMKLKEFFDSAEKKKTKTKEAVKLPSGSLELKYSKPKFIRDNDALVKWLKDNDKTHLIKTKEEPVWSEFKKSLDIEGDSAITEDGEIVEGITIEHTDDVFEVKV